MVSEAEGQAGGEEKEMCVDINLYINGSGIYVLCTLCQVGPGKLGVPLISYIKYKILNLNNSN